MTMSSRFLAVQTISLQQLRSLAKLIAVMLLLHVLLTLCYVWRTDFFDNTSLQSRGASISNDGVSVINSDGGSSKNKSSTSNTNDNFASTARDARDEPPTHHPLIPNVLIFTHSDNLLLAKYSTNSTDLELRVLADNVRHSVTLHPDATVRFLTNQDCENAIARVFPQKPHLLDNFRNEPTGMFKGDLCRGVALYETGGIYLDVDLGVRHTLWTAIRNTTTFATVRVHRASAHPGSFFQAFVAVTPHHPILLRYVELFEEYYQGKHPKYKGKPLGVVLLKKAHDDILSKQPLLKQSVELWQEVLYRFDLQHTLLNDVPPPTWGKRRACKFIVVASMEPLVVPLYSRIANSRMCPSNQTVQLS